jgi:predicted CoA-substrate-specific enzyme activase
MVIDMLTMGVDIGSASSKCVILNNAGTVVAQSVIPSGTGTSGPRRAVESALGITGIRIEQISKVIATGYGRNTYENADDRVSELTCHAKGAVWIQPGVRTVIDIGGQDAKALMISEEGKLVNFVMNDKCAAGTGRFLDVMAHVLELDVEELAELDGKAGDIAQISSTCVVFAESEVISQLAKNTPVPDLVAGIHKSAAARAASLIKRIGIIEPVLMTGGVANNAGVVRALERLLGVSIQVSPYSQTAGALGAALLALERLK